MTLRLEGPGVFGHPQVEGLLRDALRLGIPRVVAVGDVRPLAVLSDRAVIGLRGLARVEATMPVGAEPDDIDAVLMRLKRLAGVEVLRRDAECEDAIPEER